MKRAIVVGAGFYGAVCARELTDAGWDVVVLERHDHVGGHCHTEYVREAGCYLHKDGPHIFHTGNEYVWEYVNRFARFDNFVNRPKASFGGQLYSMPINLMTFYQVFGTRTPAEAKSRLAIERVPIDDPQNVEEWCLANIGATLYRILIEGYTTKQWGKHPRELPPDIIKRLPVRFTFDDNYFTHPNQGIPDCGYTTLIARILEDVPVELNYDFLEDRDYWTKGSDVVIYTGAIDEFFNYELGELDYRSLRFEHILLNCDDLQGNAVINYTDADVPWTRIVEHKHFGCSQPTNRTIVTYEYPDDWERGKEAFYPVRTQANIGLLRRYQEMAARVVPNIIFGGRLGTYRYIDMDQTIADALTHVTKVTA